MKATQTIFNISNYRQDFPILQRTNRGERLTYLDSASSAQKPIQVIDAVSRFYKQDYANIRRGIYELSERSSVMYENVRQQIQMFINAASPDEIVFTNGTTTGFNLLATCLAQAYALQAGDEIILSEMEHHANIVPWYFLKEKLGVVLKVIPITNNGELDIAAYKSLFSPRTKLVSVCHASNVLGTINPVKEMTQIAHQHGVPMAIDGAQAVAHLSVDVQDIDCDFYLFSSHKLYGPTGVGVLYGKSTQLAKLPPYQGGGDMIETVSFEKVTYAAVPQRFEAGTPDIAAVIGLGEAIRYIQHVGMSNIIEHEQTLLDYLEAELATIPGLQVLSKAQARIGVVSFIIEGIHPHDIGTILDNAGVAIRAGHHCAMPLIERLGVPATVRVSLGIYNNKDDVDTLIAALHNVMRIFA